MRVTSYCTGHVNFDVKPVHDIGRNRQHGRHLDITSKFDFVNQKRYPSYMRYGSRRNPSSTGHRLYFRIRSCNHETYMNEKSFVDFFTTVFRLSSSLSVNIMSWIIPHLLLLLRLFLLVFLLFAYWRFFSVRPWSFFIPLLPFVC